MGIVSGPYIDPDKRTEGYWGGEPAKVAAGEGSERW